MFGGDKYIEGLTIGGHGLFGTHSLGVIAGHWIVHTGKLIGCCHNRSIVLIFFFFCRSHSRAVHLAWPVCIFFDGALVQSGSLIYFCGITITMQVVTTDGEISEGIQGTLFIAVTSPSSDGLPTS